MATWEVQGTIQRPISAMIEAPSAAIALTIFRTLRFAPPGEVLDLYEEAEVTIEEEFQIYAERAERRPDLEELEDPEEDEEPLHPSNNLGCWMEQGT